MRKQRVCKRKCLRSKEARKRLCKECLSRKRRSWLCQRNWWKSSRRPNEELKTSIRPFWRITRKLEVSYSKSLISWTSTRFAKINQISLSLKMSVQSPSHFLSPTSLSFSVSSTWSLNKTLTLSFSTKNKNTSRLKQLRKSIFRVLPKK